MQIFRDQGYLTAHRILPPELEFRWAGFRGRVIELARYWHLEVDQDQFARSTMLFGRNKNGDGVFKASMKYNDLYIDQPRFFDSSIHIELCKNIYVHASMSNLKDVFFGKKTFDDGVSQEYMVFDAYPRQQIIADPETVSSLLKKIKDLQQPKNKDVAKRKVLSETSIITLGD